MLRLSFLVNDPWTVNGINRNKDETILPRFTKTIDQFHSVEAMKILDHLVPSTGACPRFEERTAHFLVKASQARLEGLERKLCEGEYVIMQTKVEV